jgi:hypothetical protein
MRNLLFSSILQVSPNNDYFVELKELAQPIPDTFVNKYKDALEGVNDVSPNTRKFLKGIAWDIKLATSTLIPLTFIVYRIIAERPWELFKSIEPSDEINHPLISTYSELYDILNCYKTEAAIRLLEFISPNSSLRSAIISAYKESDKATFCDAIVKTGCDYTNYMNKIYTLTNDYENADKIIEKCSFVKRGKISIDEFIDLIESDEINTDVPSLEQIDKFLTGKTNGIKVISEILTPLQPIVSYFKDVDYRKDCFDLSLFIDNLASLIDKQDIESLNDCIVFIETFWSYIVLNYYSQMKEGLFSKESEIIDGLICNSSNGKLICDLYEHMKNNIDENESIESQEAVEPEPNEISNLFLPMDFYDTKNRRQAESECISNIKQQLIEAGVESLCSMIDLIAKQGHIENTVEQKRNFAFRLTGFHSDYALPEKVHWHGDTNILSFIIQKFYYRGDWNNAKRLIETENKLFNNSVLKKTSFEEQEFQTQFKRLFPGL